MLAIANRIIRFKIPIYIYIYIYEIFAVKICDVNVDFYNVILPV